MDDLVTAELVGVAPADLRTAAEASLVTTSDCEELKPARVQCTECEKTATRSDGRCATHSGFRLLTHEVVKESGDFLKRNSRKYARLHLRAAEVAASKGDGRPAEWALLHTETVKPIEKQAAAGSGGTIVNVGVVLPGLREA